MVTSPIMIVDDDPGICQMLHIYLEAKGYAVQIARNGRDALTMLHTDAIPCLILLDLNMPVMTGWEFRAAQLHDPSLAQIPTAIVSADRQLWQHEEQLAAVAYFAKPIDFDRLLALVTQICV